MGIRNWAGNPRDDSRTLLRKAASQTVLMAENVTVSKNLDTNKPNLKDSEK